METVQSKAYYAIIPANVRYDSRLPANAKLLYGEITALCNERGYCWASNEYFAELYGVSKASVSSWISKLAAIKYITIQIIYKEGTKEILHRYIKLFEYPIQEILNTPIQENLKDNITLSNNTINNTLDNIYVDDEKNGEMNSDPSLFPDKMQKKPKKEREQKEKKAYGFAGLVLLTADEYAKLIQTYGEEQTKCIIDKLDSYKQSHGKTYKSDAGAIRDWVVRSLDIKPIKNNEPSKQQGFDISKEYTAPGEVEKAMDEFRKKQAEIAENKKRYMEARAREGKA